MPILAKSDLMGNFTQSGGREIEIVTNQKGGTPLDRSANPPSAHIETELASDLSLSPASNCLSIASAVNPCLPSFLSESALLISNILIRFKGGNHENQFALPD